MDAVADPKKDPAFSELCGHWMRIMNKMNQIESMPMDFGNGELLYPSEIHMVQAIGEKPGMNISALSDNTGVTRGAASQMAVKLASKGLIEKYRLPGNEKEVHIRLTAKGETAFLGHEKHHGWIHQMIYEQVGSVNQQEYEIVLRVFKAIEEVSNRLLLDMQANFAGEQEKGMKS